ncbi:MAG TPA: 2'-5' RNA ligase family protein [Chryseolinea sp.]|nr:2'-5' RNA ligase family protein [Chryseolinea sp.]
MTREEQKYFIALIPPEPLFSEIHQLKCHFREVYGARAALRSPPHITLHMPFFWPAHKEQRLVDALGEFAVAKTPIDVRLDNFSCFPPRVIYVAVRENKEMTDLQRELHRFCRMNLNLFNANYQDRPFHPHITLAFQDLRKSAFDTAWKEFENRELAGTFLVEAISLLKHNGKEWQIHAALPTRSS